MQMDTKEMGDGDGGVDVKGNGNGYEGDGDGSCIVPFQLMHGLGDR